MPDGDEHATIDNHDDDHDDDDDEEEDEEEDVQEETTKRFLIRILKDEELENADTMSILFCCPSALVVIPFLIDYPGDLAKKKVSLLL